MRLAIIIPVALCSASYGQAPPLDELKQAAAEMVEARAYAYPANRRLALQLLRARLSGNRILRLPHGPARKGGLPMSSAASPACRPLLSRMGQREAGHRLHGRYRRPAGNLAEARRRLSRPADRGRARPRRRTQRRPGGERHGRARREAVMNRYKIPGTLRVYPGIAEELLGSRTYMVNAGLFKDLDVMLSTHVVRIHHRPGGPIGSGWSRRNTPSTAEAPTARARPGWAAALWMPSN